MEPVSRRDPALFRRGISPTSKLLLGLVFSTVLIAADVKGSWLAGIRGGLERLLAPLLVAIEMPVEVAREVGRGLSVQGELLRRIARLQDDNDLLRTTRRDLELLQRENDALRTLLELPTERLAFRRNVELIQRGRGIAAQRFLIGTGLRGGIRPGMALVHPDGVVGQVTAAGDMTADVALITDAGQHTPVELARTGLRAVLVGEGIPDRASLRFLASNADIQPGDRLVTSGLDGVYPAGLPIAQVLTVERDAQSDFARVICRPEASIDGRRHFAVVVPTQSADTAAAGGTP